MDEDALADNFDIDSIIVGIEAYERLIKHIAALPEIYNEIYNEIYKTILELRYVFDYGNKEAAKFLGITPKAVSIRFGRAKILLRKLLEGG